MTIKATKVCFTIYYKEVEYIAVTKVGKEILWMKRFLQELDLKQRDYIVDSILKV